MQAGLQSWTFPNKPVILSSGVVGGPDEYAGNLSADFDHCYEDLWMGQDSYEKAQRLLIEEAVNYAVTKRGLGKEDISLFITGDLINQITPSSMAARSVQRPYLGIFSACSTSMEGLALAAFLVNYAGAHYILTGASSHHAAAERQFRYPTKYGGQKPPTAQHTVTGAGFALVGACEDKEEPHAAIISATIGTVVDHGIRDPFNMGVAMAPAAVATIIQHFKDFQVDSSHYDLIVTGDLAKAGRHMALELLQEEGWNIEPEKFVDCGLMIYSENQQVYAGGSGPGCSATVVYGHLLNEMKKGNYKRILVVATGALLSPLSVQQKETIPCIAHAVVLEWQQ